MLTGTIFFSYSRKDSEFVKQLAETLRKAGANIWLDQLDIKPSMHWDNTIEEALEACIASKCGCQVGEPNVCFKTN